MKRKVNLKEKPQTHTRKSKGNRFCQSLSDTEKWFIFLCLFNIHSVKFKLQCNSRSEFHFWQWEMVISHFWDYLSLFQEHFCSVRNTEAKEEMQKKYVTDEHLA